MNCDLRGVPPRAAVGGESACLQHICLERSTGRGQKTRHVALWPVSILGGSAKNVCSRSISRHSQDFVQSTLMTPVRTCCLAHDGHTYWPDRPPSPVR